DFASNRTDVARSSEARLAAPFARAASISASDSLSMNLSPALQQRGLVRDYYFQSAPDFVALHAFSPNQGGIAVSSDEVDLGLSVTKDVNMRGLVVIGENDDPQA